MENIFSCGTTCVR